ncbi:DUF4302 domain-containing protein [Sphingobacterium sp. SGL-16]|uniref:DUF4302 domain-containing protein n=1 Tax=Sphingobacterium sp. SGL-16 TaxID=2710883 RepID=UPI0013EABAEA|nr:DUF4302 domain-containing protein [Sphingobacterium sp. SGL-16]NGM74393.1 DUF4302 domain-containing protein [Sphingobacterium sp. SGL-16]
MKIKSFILGISILSLATSCEKKMDKIFDENPTDRLNMTVEKVYSTLQANTSSWLMEYYPSNALEFGGYTLFVKFQNSTNVVFEGDFTTKEATTSTYTVVPGAGPILTFDTYNPIFHFFALPQYYNKNSAYQLPGFINTTAGIGASNEGMKGENDFLVLKASADSVILEGRKSYNIAVLTAVNASEIAAYKAAVTKFFPLGGYSFEVGGETIAATFANSLTKRALRATITSETTSTTTTFSYRFTPNGLSFYKEYEIGGVKFKTLKYVEPTGAYIKGYFTNNEGTIKLVPST